MIETVKSSVRITSPLELKDVPLPMPSSKPSPMDHDSKSSRDCATSSFDISTQLSRTVAFVGTLNAVNSEPPSAGLTASGPRHSETFACVVGRSNIKAAIKRARLAFARYIVGERRGGIINSAKDRICIWSHWGELNPRPSPYQGDAIPLSHSGGGFGAHVVDLIAA